MERKKINIAIVGATGLVGQKFIELLEEYNIPINELRLFASKKSKGRKMRYQNQLFEVDELKEDSFKNIDYALFSAGKEVSKKFVPIAIKSGSIVIDNSSYFRMNNDVPLVVPEINFDDIQNTKIISNPNCSTIQCVLPLYYLSKKFTIKRIFYSTYQSVSGSGMKGLFDYENSLLGYENEFFSSNITQLCIPFIGAVSDNNYTEEEIKMINETKKILHLNSIKIDAMCVRVPIRIGHGVSVFVEVEENVDFISLKQILERKKGIKLLDNKLPSYKEMENSNDIFISRLKINYENTKVFSFYTICNNLRKGAAANAVQILKKLIDI